MSAYPRKRPFAAHWPCPLSANSGHFGATAGKPIKGLRLRVETARLLALKLGQASAAVAATMGKAKILGLIIDRREVGDVGAFDGLTDEELVRKAEEKARELGLCVQPLNKAH